MSQIDNEFVVVVDTDGFAATVELLPVAWQVGKKKNQVANGKKNLMVHW